MHGIKIQHPLTMLGIFLALDAILNWWLEMIDTLVFPDVAPLIISLWLFGFVSDYFKLDD